MAKRDTRKVDVKIYTRDPGCQEDAYLMYEAGCDLSDVEHRFFLVWSPWNGSLIERMIEQGYERIHGERAFFFVKDGRYDRLVNAQTR